MAALRLVFTEKVREIIPYFPLVLFKIRNFRVLVWRVNEVRWNSLTWDVDVHFHGSRTKDRAQEQLTSAPESHEISVNLMSPVLVFNIHGGFSTVY